MRVTREYSRVSRIKVTRRLRLCLPVLGAVLTVVGCADRKAGLTVETPFPPGFSIAVAPILNFSGQFDLDPVQAADLLASELTSFGSVVVLPVNRVVAALAAEGRLQVESPQHALDIADAVGADALVVAGITEYDAYTPIVGVVLQMYTAANTSESALDVVAVSRRADDPMATTAMADARWPAAQIQRVYNASHGDVLSAVRDYAEPRSAGESPFGWRQYVKVQKLYLRFCWHDALERLMKQQFRQHAVLASSGSEDGT